MNFKEIVKKSHYKDENGVIFLGNCIELIGQIPNKSINLIIADPPYVISRKSNFHTMPDRKNSRTGTTFGEWDKEFENEEWIKLCYNKLKNNGSIIIFNDFKKVTIIYDICKNVGLEYKDTLIWKKTNPMSRNRNRRYIPDVEMLQWYVKGKGWIFDRQDEKYESCIKFYPSESRGGFKRYHKTQKPLKLIKDLNQIHSNRNDIILDPFLGSGTTAIASKELNRKYIGIEIEEKYCNKSIERLRDIK